MTERYQLKHPEGKKLSSIDLSKYKLIKEAIIHSLSNSAPISHKEMFLRVKSYLQKNKKEFTGSVEWYMEGVKLDLETEGMIIRMKVKQRMMFKLS